jgi:hypothetical protein
VQAYVSKVYRFMAGMTGASIAGGVIGASIGFPPLLGFLGYVQIRSNQTIRKNLLYLLSDENLNSV